MSDRPKYSIRAQLMRLSFIIVVVAIVLSLAGTLYLTLRSERESLDSNLLNSATILARVPLIRDALTGAASSDTLADFLDEATAHVSDIDLILVGDTDGILHYAPDQSDIGSHYIGTAQQAILEGANPYTSNETGPMGSDHSAYAPIQDAQGNLLGFVIVGVYMRSMAQATVQTVLQFVAIGLLAVLLGSLLALRLSRQIKQSLQGYEPDAFAQRLNLREDILEALEEGILAIDREANIVFLNHAAADMLSLVQQKAIGQPLHAVYPRSTLDRVLHTGQAEYNVSMRSLKDVQVLADRLPLYDDGTLTGAVGIFRNRTEVTHLANDLTGVRHMVEAMRAYTHEFMNKLHVILGLLQIGAPDKAQQYIMDTTRTHQEAVTRIMNQIHEPSVAALLVGKTSRANELGIRLTLDQDSVLREESPWLPPNAYVTVLGNLIENAIEGLNQSLRGTKQITVSIREDESGLLLCVEDTGPGIPADLRRRLFQRGATSKGEGRGTGLSLVQEVVTTYHGTIRVESDAGVGTSFFIHFRREDLPNAEEEFNCIRS